MIDFDVINEELDSLADKHYNSASEAWADVALMLKEKGFEVPVVEDFENEMMFRLESSEIDEPRYLVVVMDDGEGGEEEDNTEQPGVTKYSVYVTFADENELGLFNTMDAIWADETGVTHHLRTRKMGE